MAALESFLLDLAFFAVVGILIVVVMARRRRVSPVPTLVYLLPPYLVLMTIASSTRLFIADFRTRTASFVGIVVLGMLVFSSKPVKDWLRRRIADATYRRMFRGKRTRPPT